MAFTIGKGLAYSYINKYILFNIKNPVKKRGEDNNEYYHIKLKSVLEDIYDRISNKTFEKEELDTLIAPYTFLDNEERDRCYTLLQISLYDADFGGDRYNKINLETYNKLDLTLRQICLKEGTKILDLLVEHKVISMYKEARRNIPCITFTEELKTEMIASSTYFKPYLNRSNKKVLPKLERKIAKDLSFMAYQEDIKFKTSPDVYISPHENAFNYIEGIDNVTYRIDRKQVTAIFSFFKNALEKVFDKEDNELLRFCYMIYDIDFTKAFWKYWQCSLIRAGHGLCLRLRDLTS